jgi:hypothetical protein
MTLLSVPNPDDFDRVALPSKSYRLTSEQVARKLAESGDPDRLVGFDYTLELLIAAGVGPGDFDLDLLPIIQKRAAEMARERIAQKRDLTIYAIAFGVIVAAMLHSLPALASEPDWFETDVAPWAFLGLIAVGFVLAIWPRRERAARRASQACPHAAGFDVEEWRR